MCYFKVLLPLWCLFHVVTLKDLVNLRGHLQPLGLQRDADGHIQIFNELPTHEQFRHLLRDGQPALLKNVVKKSPAFTLWSDEYLKNNFGNLTIKLEGKSEDQSRPAGKLGTGFDVISNFLDTYQDESKYAVTQLPDPMRKDISVMPFMNCGPLNKSIIESHLWMSSGNTRSKLHRDNTFTLNCLLRGTKSWILVDPKYKDKLYLRSVVDNHSGVSAINPLRVNLIRYPNIAHVPFKYGNVTSGDCIFVPVGYAHQVRSYGPTNMAFTFLFELDDNDMKNFDYSECSNKNDYVPLSRFYLGWSYSGYGSLSMGNVEPYKFRKEILEEWFMNKSAVKLKDLIKIQLTELYKYEVVDSDGTVGKDKVQEIPIEDFKELAFVTELDSNRQNDINYEYYMIDYQDLRERVTMAIFKRNGTLNQVRFKELYKELLGSNVYVDRFMAYMDENKDGIVDRNELKSNLDKALEPYRKSVHIDDDTEHDNSTNEDREYEENSNDDQERIIDDEDEENFNKEHSPNHFQHTGKIREEL